jgi:Putative peptidoglycan binding domain
LPIKHIVQQGDCLSSIACQYGFADWKTIYYDDLNTQLREQRPDWNVLFPGDEIQIPDKAIKSVTCSTDMSHEFEFRSTETQLRLVLHDIDGKPLARKRYDLVIDGVSHHGILNDAGGLERPIPPHSSRGELTVFVEEESQSSITWPLDLGHLDPIDSLSGIQARLNNLGYDAGPVDGVNGPRTRAAVTAFQKDNGLKIDGIPGPKTQAALKSKYGC